MRKLLLAVVLLAVVVGGAFGGYQWWQQREAAARERARQDAAQLASQFVSAWQSGDYTSMATMAGNPPDLADTYRATTEQLHAKGLTVTAGDAQLTDPERVDAGASAPFEATVELGSLGRWTYDGTIPMRRTPDDAWQVDWSPSVVHPKLTADTHLALTSTWPDRAPILDRDGTPIETAGTTLGNLVGRVGEITAEQLDELGAPYEKGDTVGLSGLQRVYERQLAGSPSGAVQLISDASGDPVEELQHFDGTDPKPLHTTFDLDLQRTAEAALPAGSPNSAMVVLDADTSEIRAVVNRPASGFDRALGGRYAPGSTFKIVTTLAALRNGVTPDTTISCPAKVRIHGRWFSNYQGEVLGDIPFTKAFYESCNTAFVQVAADLPEHALQDAAETLGFNSGYTLPLGKTVASYPTPKDLAERAAAAIGQARVEATPVHMASVAAAIASGAWKPPVMVTGGQQDGQPSSIADEAPKITTMMQEVPRIGTAAGAGVPDGVAGKTGTAEFGTGDPLPTHAWFVGFQAPQPEGTDRLAFAVMFDEGSSGGGVAAPVAARFLRAVG